MPPNRFSLADWKLRVHFKLGAQTVEARGVVSFVSNFTLVSMAVITTATNKINVVNIVHHSFCTVTTELINVNLNWDVRTEAGEV